MMQIQVDETNFCVNCTTCQLDFNEDILNKILLEQQNVITHYVTLLVVVGLEFAIFNFIRCNK